MAQVLHRVAFHRDGACCVSTRLSEWFDDRVEVVSDAAHSLDGLGARGRLCSPFASA